LEDYMHVLFQLKVPLDLAQGLRAKLDEVTTDHVAEVVELGKRAKGASDPSKLAAQAALLDRRGKRINIQSLVREAMRLGLESINRLDSKAVMARLSKDEIVRGRPALKLVGGTKRGG
jgi:hypothetical protein